MAKDFRHSELPRMACPVCKTTGSLQVGDRVHYTDPLIYEVRCISCKSTGKAGFVDMSETATYVEMTLVQPAPRKP